MKRRGQYRDEEVISNIGARIRDIRVSKNISQQHLADLCDVDLSQINRIELGKINTSVSILFLISKKLNVPVEEIVKIKRGGG